jgi:glycosyltransferase involved in cell wall biosynthesis
MRPEKDLPLLLKAWDSVHRARPSARLAIVGDGPEMRTLQEEAERLDLGSSLLLPGSTDDPKAWYAAADLYVLSSTNEGLSNSLMEALGCGLPIVSTCVSGSEDIFDVADVGLLVPVGDVGALENAIIELLSDHDRARACGRRSTEYAVAHFSLGAVADKIESLYFELVSEATIA